MDEKEKRDQVVVPLELIVDAVEMADDEWNQYLDIEEMEVVSLPESSFLGEYDEELADLIEEGWNERFFRLPSKFDIHEYGIMEEFVWSLPEGRMRDSMENAIRGRGAFRRFKDAVGRYDIEEEWYGFEEEKYREIAKAWCEENHFAYREGSEGNEKIIAADPSRVQETVYAADMPDIREAGVAGAAENLAWEEVRTEHIVQDQWIDFRRSDYRFPDGTVFGPYYSYSRRDYVVIAASDEDGRYLCVRQFRQGIGEVTTEFPAGGIERTDGREYGSRRDPSLSEDALAAAKRELLEETGYVSDNWTHLLTVPANATLADNYAYIFMAENCRKSGEQKLDETEFLNVRTYTPDDIETMINEGGFQQAIHVMAWLLARRG